MVLVPPGHRRNLPGAKWWLSLYLSGMEISTTCVKHWDGIFAITQDGEPRSLTVSRFQYGFPNPRHPRLISGTKINWSGSSESGSCRATQLSAPRPAPVSTPRPRRRGEQSQDGGRAGVRVRSVCEARRQRLPDSAPGLQPRLQVLSPRHCSVCVPGRGWQFPSRVAAARSCHCHLWVVTLLASPPGLLLPCPPALPPPWLPSSLFPPL